MFDIFAQEQYAIPTVGFTATVRGIFLNRNNVLNQPKTHIRDHNGFHAWTYFFEGGKDNYHHVENRSSIRKSYSFPAVKNTNCCWGNYLWDKCTLSKMYILTKKINV